MPEDETLSVEVAGDGAETEKSVAETEEKRDLEHGAVSYREKATLYEEVRRPMMGAFFMFLMADMRQMAAEGLLEGDEEQVNKLLNLPMSGREFSILYRENRKRIAEYIESEERYEMYNDFIDATHHEPQFEERYDENHLSSLDKHVLYHYDDEKAEEECVYGVAVNHVLKRVSLEFRGSVTQQDFIQDAKAVFTPIPNPVKAPAPEDEETHDAKGRNIFKRVTDEVHIHLGFREYLYGVQKMDLVPKFMKEGFKKGTAVTKETVSRGASFAKEGTSKAKDTVVGSATKAKDIMTEGAARAGSIVGIKTNKEELQEKSEEEQINEEFKSKEEKPETETGTTDKAEEEEQEEEQQRYKVMLEMLAILLAENPGYELYVGGHSLGGALATLFAFEAAASDDPRIPKPVTCVTTGAPKVGNLDFLESFEALEELGKLRFLRVVNYRDIVPLSPPDGSYDCFSLCCFQHMRFRQVGLRLRLMPNGYQITYPPKARSWFGNFWFDLMKIIRHYFFLILVCPVVCFCKNRYTYKAFRSEHTQLAYMRRFDAVREYLEKYTLDGLYKEKRERAKWRKPVLHSHPKVVKAAGKDPVMRAESLLDF